MKKRSLLSDTELRLTSDAAVMADLVERSRIPLACSASTNVEAHRALLNDRT